MSAFLKKLIYALPLFFAVAFLAPSAQADTYQLYGQAYSPNIGWINFYCNDGDTDPNVRGVQVNDNFCTSDVNYAVNYDPTTGTLIGQTYAPNLGWLELTGVNASAAGLSGSTTAFNFGKTCFRSNAADPDCAGGTFGVSYDGLTGMFKGFAYSKNIGFISFQRDDTVAGYGGQDYAVKMGMIITSFNNPRIVSYFGDTNAYSYTDGKVIATDQAYYGQHRDLGDAKNIASITLPDDLGIDPANIHYQTQETASIMIDPEQIDQNKLYRMTFQGSLGSYFQGSTDASGHLNHDLRGWLISGRQNDMSEYEKPMILEAITKPEPTATPQNYVYQFHVDTTGEGGANGGAGYPDWNNTTRANYNPFALQLWGVLNSNSWWEGSVEISNLKVEEMDQNGVALRELPLGDRISTSGMSFSGTTISTTTTIISTTISNKLSPTLPTKTTSNGDGTTTYSWTTDTPFSGNPGLPADMWAQAGWSIMAKIPASSCKVGTYPVRAANDISSAPSAVVDKSKANIYQNITIPSCPAAPTNGPRIVSAFGDTNAYSYTDGKVIAADQAYYGQHHDLGDAPNTASITLPDDLGIDPANIHYQSQEAVTITIDPRQIDQNKTYRLTFQGSLGGDFQGSTDASGHLNYDLRAWSIGGQQNLSLEDESPVIMTRTTAPEPTTTPQNYEYQFHVDTTGDGGANRGAGYPDWNTTTRANYAWMHLAMWGFGGSNAWWEGSVEISNLKLEEIDPVTGVVSPQTLPLTPLYPSPGMTVNGTTVRNTLSPKPPTATSNGDGTTTYSWTTPTPFTINPDRPADNWTQVGWSIMAKIPASSCKVGTYPVKAANDISSATDAVDKSLANISQNITIPSCPVASSSLFCTVKTVDYTSATPTYSDYYASNKIPTGSAAGVLPLTSLLHDPNGPTDLFGVRNSIPEIICTTANSDYCNVDTANSSAAYNAVSREYTFTLRDTRYTNPAIAPAPATCKFRFPTANLGACGSAVSFSTTTTTTGSVTATAASCPTSLPGCTLPAAQTFNANGSKIFFFEDAIGRSATCHADVNWIDKKQTSLSASNSGSTGTCAPDNYSTNWRNSETASASFAMGNTCTGSGQFASSCTVPPISSSCSLAQGNQGTCTVSASNSCTYNTTGSCYDRTVSQTCGGECTSNDPITGECTGNAATYDCSYPVYADCLSSATCTQSDNCTSAGANVDKTAPYATTDAKHVLWTPANFHNWTGWTSQDITAQVGCNDDLSGCSSLLSSVTFTTNGSQNAPLQDVAGNSSSAPISISSWIDKQAPAMTPVIPATPASVGHTVDNTFEATTRHAITLSFSDSESYLRYVKIGLRGEDLRGEDGAYAKIYHQYTNNPVDFYEHDIGSQSDWTAVFDVNLSKAQKYTLTYKICDTAGKCNDGSIAHFLHVVAGNPVWTASGCASGATNCPGKLTLPTKDTSKIADGTAEHEVQVELRDKFGNPVVSEAGIKKVESRVNFMNTVVCDQVENKSCTGSGTSTDGDAITYRGGETFASGDPAALARGSQDTGLLQETNGFYPFDAPGDGKYSIFISSVAPTALPTDVGYKPITGSGQNAAIKSITVIKTDLTGVNAIGKANSTFKLSSAKFMGFLPALDATSAALNFDGTRFAAETSAIENITINARKNFRVQLKNQGGQATSDQSLGLLIHSNKPNISWASGRIENIGDDVTSLAVTDTPLTDDFKVFTRDPTFPGGSSWNTGSTLPAAAQSSNAGDSVWLRLSAIPRLAIGNATANRFNNIFIPYLKYTVNGQTVAHRTWQLGSDTDPLYVPLQNSGIQIIGTVNSSDGVASNDAADQIHKKIGDVSRNELKANIDRNALAVMHDDDLCKASSGAGNTITISNGDQMTSGLTGGCYRQNNEILFVKGDVVLEAASGADTLVLPATRKTILVKGGNVYIKSNLAYKNNAGSFGIVVLRDEEGGPHKGGNVYIYPNVTNVNAALYAEGALISTNKNGITVKTNHTSAFADRSYELNSQLYWEGLLATWNTIGGSDTNPFKCPSQVEDCSSRATARLYDFSYLRTFTEKSDGVRAGKANSSTSAGALIDLNAPPDGAANNHAVIIRYDGRITSNPPPLFAGTSSSASVEAGY